MAERMVLFVCTGNMCRSPMAEYLLRSRLTASSGWRVASSGTAASSGFPASYGALAVLEEWGMDMQSHRSQPLTDELADRAEVIVVMTLTHREIVRQQFPDAADKVHLLKSFDLTASGWDIDDPVGLPIPVYRGIRNEINKALPGLISFLERHEIPESYREGGWAAPFDMADEEEL